MNGFSDLSATLQGMGFRQLLPAFTACMAYAIAQGRIVGQAARRWAWGVVVVSAITFSALCRPWEHGVILAAFALAGMGLFTGLVWLVSSLIGFRTGAAGTQSALGTDSAAFDRPGDDALGANALPVPEPRP